MLAVVGALHLLPERTALVPERDSFTLFPRTLGEWRQQGTRQMLTPEIAEVLGADDYHQVTFARPGAEGVAVVGTQATDLDLDHAPLAIAHDLRLHPCAGGQQADHVGQVRRGEDVAAVEAQPLAGRAAPKDLRGGATAGIGSPSAVSAGGQRDQHVVEFRALTLV